MKVSLPMLEQFHKKLGKMPGFSDFENIDNRNVRGFCLCKDGLHLLETEKKLLSNKHFLGTFFFEYVYHTHSNWTQILVYRRLRVINIT